MSKKYLYLAVVGVLVFIAFGGAEIRVSLVDTNQVTVTSRDSEKIKIFRTDVYQKDGCTWAYGVLKQRDYHPSLFIKTHVDVQVLSEDGSVQYEPFSEDIYVPRNRIGKGPDWKRFRVKLVEKIPAGSRVNILVHSGRHEVSVG